jgi:aminoglycoside phosphotransferase (APT) family kinase protein
LPTRITHNDTKVNNVLFEKGKNKAICVIDLDTVMPGVSLFDFGDLVRSATCPTAEDEKDLSKVFMRMDYFKAISQGWWDAGKSVLVPEEKEHMAFSAKLITYELAMRFLSDHLNGDQYFKIKYPGQNLDRAKTQIKLVQSIIEQEDEMTDFVNALE